MNDELSTYLNDHRAGARFALELLERIRDGNADQAVRALAAELLPQIKEDYTLLESIAQEMPGNAGSIKEAAGWVAEKFSRVKLRLTEEGSVGTFECLEMLALGILGKMKLWQVLALLIKDVSQLNGIDFDRLIARAQTQHDTVESKRIEVALVAFRSMHRATE
jgi:hypothetical protein